MKTMTKPLTIKIKNRFSDLYDDIEYSKAFDIAKKLFLSTYSAKFLSREKQESAISKINKKFVWYQFIIDEILEGEDLSPLYKDTDIGVCAIESPEPCKDDKKMFAESIEQDPRVPKAMNKLAREQMKTKILADINIDLTICDIEWRSKQEYIKDLQDLLNWLLNNENNN